MSLTVVLVDDSQPYLEAVTLLLEQEGADVVGTASTADQAVARVREARPDVVLLDLHLGETSGLDVARLLTEDGATATLILVSTAPREDVEPLLGDMPVAGFVPKEQLSAAAVQALLASDRGAADPR